MNRLTAVLAVGVLVVAGLSVPVAGSATPPVGLSAQVDAPNGSAAPAPGARLAGVVAIQATEVESEVEGRAFGLQIARSSANATRADAVADRLTLLERRAATIRERQRTLEAARENGTISRARYEAELAVLTARSTALERQLTATATVSAGLPADLLAERGVNATEIDALRSEARTMTGPEAAAIARTIAGPDAGSGLSSAANASAGPPTDRPDRPGRDESGTPTAGGDRTPPPGADSGPDDRGADR